MKYGYSLFLQEYVDPRDVDYDDTRLFQITCPECKEPVFKVARENSEPYFSHYKKDETLIKQCELRVNALTSSQVSEVIAQSRNQKLSLFIKLFQDIFWNDELIQEDKLQIKKYYYQLQRSQIFMEIKQKFLLYARDLIKDRQSLMNMLDETIQNKFEGTEIYDSGFAWNIQKKYAYDFLTHLLAGHSKTNFLFLLSVSFIELYLDLKKKKPGLEDWQEILFTCLNKFFRTQNNNKRITAFQEMTALKSISSSSGRVIDGYALFTIQMFQYAFRILLRIPYLKILKKNNGKDG